MTNLSITLQCNRDCSYCFARPLRRKGELAATRMDRAMFLCALDFLRQSGINQVRLLGGEPTLHPHFEGLVTQALDRGFRLLVFSNGLMPEAALRCLEEASPERVSVLVNLPSPWEQNSHEARYQALTLGRLGRRATLGFNLHTASPDLDFLLLQVERHRLNRSVRLGLAHPCRDGSNHCLRPKEYAEAGRHIAGFVQQAAGHGITVELDCGFVPCMFPEGFLESPGVDPAAIGPRCGPVPDILPDGSVVPCYPLASTWRLSLSDGGDAPHFRSRFEEQMQPYRTLGIFRQCATCARRAGGQCLGGCLAAAMQRLRHTPFALTEPKETAAVP
ncbi:MAG: radical SAM protein [Candidatus Tectomicrobia bacterium]|uniref:Radical SAM protein n=1 Tax=Tectimicrobiota bacterium TaxID=2528274 RepID=A0A932FY17_UNCTE|nr:radical SAM protein [Candidatus Tectomicrobia bacterium]